MRSFQNILSFLFALFVCAMAQQSESYDTTVYITSTVMLVNTVTMSGSPTGAVANQTSTIAAVVPTAYSTANVTVAPTATAAKPTDAAEFTGAASALGANALLAAMAAGAAYLVL
jgi:hypothetical protein